MANDLQNIGIIPGVASLIAIPISMWQIGTTMVIAIRQALDYKSTLRAIGVVLIGKIPAGFVLLFMTIILVGMLGIE